MLAEPGLDDEDDADLFLASQGSDGLSLPEHNPKNALETLTEGAEEAESCAASESDDQSAPDDSSVKVDTGCAEPDAADGGRPAAGWLGIDRDEETSPQPTEAAREEEQSAVGIQGAAERESAEPPGGPVEAQGVCIEAADNDGKDNLAAKETSACTTTQRGINEVAPVEDLGVGLRALKLDEATDARQPVQEARVEGVAEAALGKADEEINGPSSDSAAEGDVQAESPDGDDSAESAGEAESEDPVLGVGQSLKGLLGDYAVLLTPVRMLGARGTAEGAPSASEASALRVESPLEGLADPDDSPELASPLSSPAQAVHVSGKLALRSQVASVIRFPTPADSPSEESRCSESPASRPPSATEHPRWQVTLHVSYHLLLQHSDRRIILSYSRRQPID